MKLKQQDAEAELEGLKRKREERRKVMEEEERKRKQEQEEKKAQEQVEARSLQSSPSVLSIISRLCWCVRLPQEERRKMKEEIEKRRAEAAEKKKQKEEEVGTGKPAFSISTKGSSKVSLTTGPLLLESLLNSALGLVGEAEPGKFLFWLMLEMMRSMTQVEVSSCVDNVLRHWPLLFLPAECPGLGDGVPEHSDLARDGGQRRLSR